MGGREMADNLYVKVFYNPEKNLAMRNLAARESRKKFFSKVKSILWTVSQDITLTAVSGGTVKLAGIAKTVSLELINSAEISLFFSAKDLLKTLQSFPRVWTDFKRSASLSTDINKLFPNGPPAKRTAFMKESIKQVVLDCVTQVHGVTTNAITVAGRKKRTLKLSHKTYLIQVLSLTPAEVKYLNWRSVNLPGKVYIPVPAGLSRMYRTVRVGRYYIPVRLWGTRGAISNW